MEQSHPPFIQHTPICPSCHCDQGRRSALTMDQPRRTIRYVCYACLHHWNVTEPDNDLLLWPLQPFVALEPRH